MELPVHEGRHLGHLAQAVFFFDAHQAGVSQGRVGLGLVSGQQGAQLQGQLVEEVAGPAGVVDGRQRPGALGQQRAQRQAIEQEAHHGQGRKKLPLALLHARVEEALEQVAQELVGFAGAQAHVLEQHQPAQHLGVEGEQLFVVDLDESKSVVGKKLQRPEIRPNGVASGVGVVLHVAKRLVNLLVGDVGHLLVQHLVHAVAVQLLKTVLQVKVGIKRPAAPAKPEGLGVLVLVHDFAQQQVHQLVEGVFAAGHVVLAQDGGKAVVSAGDVGRAHALEVGQPVAGLAELERWHSRLKQAAWGAFAAIGLVPGPEHFAGVASLGKGEGLGIGVGRAQLSQKLLVVVGAHQVQVVGHVGGVGRVQVRGVEGHVAGAFCLLGVAQGLAAVVLHAAPGLSRTPRRAFCTPR